MKEIPESVKQIIDNLPDNMDCVVTDNFMVIAKDIEAEDVLDYMFLIFANPTQIEADA